MPAAFNSRAAVPTFPRTPAIVTHTSLARLCLASAAALLSGACTDSSVTLHGQGGLALSYECVQPRARARTAEEHALVRTYAINALRDARNRGSLTDADSVIAAVDPRQLEVAVIRYVCAHGDVRGAARRVFPEPGSMAKDFELPRYTSGTAGERVRFGDQRGRIVVLNFWATWCGPCRKELPELHQVAERYRDRGVVVYGVLNQDDPERAADFMRKQGVEIPLLVDRDHRVADLYRVRGLPHTYIIGRDGRILRGGPGYAGPGSLEKAVQEVLGL